MSHLKFASEPKVGTKYEIHLDDSLISNNPAKKYHSVTWDFLPESVDFTKAGAVSKDSSKLSIQLQNNTGEPIAFEGITSNDPKDCVLLFHNDCFHIVSISTSSKMKKLDKSEKISDQLKQILSNPSKITNSPPRFKPTKVHKKRTSYTAPEPQVTKSVENQQPKSVETIQKPREVETVQKPREVEMRPREETVQRLREIESTKSSKAAADKRNNKAKENEPKQNSLADALADFGNMDDIIEKEFDNMDIDKDKDNNNNNKEKENEEEEAASFMAKIEGSTKMDTTTKTDDGMPDLFSQPSEPTQTFNSQSLLSSNPPLTSQSMLSSASMLEITPNPTQPVQLTIQPLQEPGEENNDESVSESSSSSSSSDSESSK